MVPVPSAERLMALVAVMGVDTVMLPLLPGVAVRVTLEPDMTVVPGELTADCLSN
jgi:hypothetical protein